MKGARRTCLFCCILSICLLSCGYMARLCYAPVATGTGLSANPLSVTVPVGGTGQSTINVSGKGNPAPWPVDLSASSINGVSTSFNPQQVILPPSGAEWNSNQSILTINAGISAVPGTYSLTVYADFGIITRNVSIALTITGDQQPDTTVGGYIEDSKLLETVDWQIALTTVTVVVTAFLAFTYYRKTTQ